MQNGHMPGNAHGNVQSIFMRPRDMQWSDEEIDLTWSVFSLMGADFVNNATDRELKVLAAFWRREAARLPEKAPALMTVARSFDKLAETSWPVATRMRWKMPKQRRKIRLVWRDGVLLEPALLNS